MRTAIIFDLDGTLTRPFLDFDAIRAEIGVSGPILEAMEKLDESDRSRAEEVLLRHEWHAARNATLHDEAAEVVAECRARGFPVAILTRNARPTAEHVLREHGIVVDALRSREDGAIKPAPDGVLALCRQLNANPTASWMVGDFHFDILAGRAAGATTVLMIGDDPLPRFAPEANHVIRRLRELLQLIPESQFD